MYPLVSGYKLLVRDNFTQQTQAPANKNARSKQWQPWLAACQRKKALAFLAVFVYATHATQAIAFEWKPGFTRYSTLQQIYEYVRCAISVAGPTIHFPHVTWPTTVQWQFPPPAQNIFFSNYASFVYSAQKNMFASCCINWPFTYLLSYLLTLWKILHFYLIRDRLPDSLHETQPTRQPQCIRTTN